MSHRVVLGSVVVGMLAMLSGCGASVRSSQLGSATAADARVAPAELWVTHDETEMSISGGKEHSVHHEEETALRPKLVTQRKARQ